MADTDDKMTDISEESGKDVPPVADVLPSDEKDTPSEDDSERRAEKTEKTEKASSFVGELVGVSVKAIAVALSLFVLIISILTVAMPLSAMRVFNNLGMSERALNSGDRYIMSRLEAENADSVDENGEYSAIRLKQSLADADMTEALDVCVTLADGLMRDYVDSDAKSAAYFADELDKYVRIYLSLYGESAISSEKSKKMLDAVAPALHPFVYSYRHNLATMDYAARVYSGDAAKLDTMVWPAGSASTNIMWSTRDFSRNMRGLDVSAETSWSNQMTSLDWFVDYIDQISTYLGIREEKLGLTKTTNEVEAGEKYSNALGGYEFSLFVTPENGFTELYYDLKEMFGKYVRLAYNFNTRGETELQLHRLYWLRIMTTAADRLWNMGVLLNVNNKAYGQHWRDVYDEFGSFTFHYFKDVPLGDDNFLNLVQVYNEAMADYLRNFPAA